jgi:N6-adenosine-specific RNA methylase IME4
MPEGYQVICADPPWRYEGSTKKWGAAEKFYSTMTDEAIFNLELPLISPGVIFVWATGPKMDVAVEAIRSWGLYYRGVSFVWIKCKKDGTPIGAQGVRPSIVKPLTEFVLVGSTQRTGRPLPLASEKIVQTVFAPKGAHSAKPVEVMDRIDEMYPGYRKLEMFSRGRPHNSMWDVHGFESEAEVA